MFQKVFFTTILILVFGLCFFGRTENIYAYSYECSDNIDNDGDGKKDYSATAGAGDAQCASATDDHEGDNPRSYFFNTHTTYNQKIPSNTAISSRSAVVQDNLKNVRNRKGYVPAITVDAGQGNGTYGGTYNTYVDDGTFEPVTITMQATYSGTNAADAIAKGWNTNIPMKANTFPVNNMDYCAPGSPYYDNHWQIISLPNAQGIRKIWDIYQGHNCSLYKGLDKEGVTQTGVYDKTKWHASFIRMYYSNENGVDSQVTAAWNPPGDMNCDPYPLRTNDPSYAPASPGGARLNGALTYDEVANGTIDHAIEFTWIWRWSPTGIYLDSPYPACNTPSRGTWRTDLAPYYPSEGNLMAGERLQLNMTHAQIDAYADSQGWNQYKKNILYAIADYGMIMSEASGGDNLSLHVVMENGGQSPKHTKSDWLALLGGSNGMPAYVLWDYIRVVPSPTPPFSGQPQCADGIDNDGDGKIDYPADPGCSSAYSDNAELDSAIACSSFTYSPWSACQSNTQTRTIISSSPAGCTGGSPILTQSCTSYGLNDFISLISNWLKTIVSPADVNKDGIVNTRDLGIMMTNWQ